jgi:hypothetical protein
MKFSFYWAIHEILHVAPKPNSSFISIQKRKSVLIRNSLFSFWAPFYSLLKRPLTSPNPSVLPCLCPPTTARIFVKFYIGNCYENLSKKKSKFHRNRTKISGTLLEDVNAFNIVDSDVCRATIQKTYCCASVTKISVRVTLLATDIPKLTTHALQQW